MRFLSILGLGTALLVGSIQTAQALAPRAFLFDRIRPQTSRISRATEDRLRRALQSNPYSADAHIGLGVALHNQCRWREAEEAFLSGLNLDPESSLGWQHYGKALYSEGRLKEAEAAFKAARRITPDDPSVYMGRTYHNQQLPGLVDTLYEQEKWSETMAAYQSAVDLDPDHYFNYLELGRSLTNLGYEREAITVFVAIAQASPDTTNETYIAAASSSYNEIAKLLEREGRVEEAEDWYRASIQRFSTGYRGLISLLEEQGRLEEAAMVEATIPNSKSVSISLPSSHTRFTPSSASRMQLPQSSITQDISAEVQNSAVDQYISEAEDLYAQQKYEEAETAFRQALCFGSEDTSIDYETRNRARFGAGDSLYRRGLRVAAKEMYESVFFRDKGTLPVCELREILLSRELFSTMEEVESILPQESDETCSDGSQL